MQARIYHNDNWLDWKTIQCSHICKDDYGGTLIYHNGVLIATVPAYILVILIDS